MKRLICYGLGLLSLLSARANNESPVEQDTIQSRFLNELIVSGSTKETNDLKTLPASVSFITPRMIENQNIVSLKNLSNLIPNFFVADYGSRLSSPVYIRGIGERSTGQSIGMYVDNMPLMDKSVFDFDFMDVRQIEVLRGPQGTLYGRNAMSGIVSLFTHSPLDYQRTKLGLTAGNYGLLRAKAGTSFLLTDAIGVSINGYYDGHTGYFTNTLTGEDADPLKSGGGRLRLDWRVAPRWTVQLTANYDYSDQGAFPYANYNQGAIAQPEHNFPGSYLRQTAGGNLNLQYKDERIIFNSSTGFLYFDDDMKMDIDYSPLDMFSINQKQSERAWTEELTVKSNTKYNYQWSFGAFGFHNDLKTRVLTTMGPYAVEHILQRVFDGMQEEHPNMPDITVLDERIPIPGLFKTPSYGAAVFHQSTYNNLLTEGLSLTAGLRLDYEKASLDYDTGLDMMMRIVIRGMDMTLPAGVQLIGEESTSFTKLLPKLAMKYELNARNYLYATVGNGYKTGGYNIQNFADLAQIALRKKYENMGGTASEGQGDESGEQLVDISQAVTYRPELSWNYEVGFKGELIKGKLFAELAAFYIDVKDIQITDFVDSGQGRILKNAGRARSMGFDLALTAPITHELSLAANYGFTRATFKDYKVSETENLKGNYIPFAPQNTLALSAVYTRVFRNQWIDRFFIQANYNGSGRIYWTEANDVWQDFYGLLNLKAGLTKGMVDLNVWVNNLLGTDYTAFYFETNTARLAQAGRPLTWGVDLTVSF